MRPAIFLLACILLAAMHADALAARPDTRTMTCAAARELVGRSGAIVMTTGRYTYDRIVSGLRYCEPDEETRLFTAPTLDDPKCRIGYVCRPAVLFDDGFFRFRRF